MKKKETYRNILHLFFSGYIDLLPKDLREKTLLHGAGNWFMYALRYIAVYKRLLFLSLLKKSLPFQNKVVLKDKIWIFADTTNQFQSTKFLDKNLQNTTWVSRKFSTPGTNFTHLLGLSRLWYLFQFPHILRLLSPINPSLKGKIFEASGQFDFFKKILKKYRPKLLIFSNDHSIAPRSLLLAAKSLSIPTVYIQHASVSPFFPNLEASLNLLEGQHALDCYKKCGPIKGKVALIGMPKFEQYKHLQNTNPNIQNIGIAFNPSDKQTKIENFINTIVPQFPQLKFTFRKHPREERLFLFQSFPNLNESLPNQENVFEYLKGQDIIFAGDSSIHLEATLLNIVSVYYDFTEIKEKEDYYGFVKNGMIPRLKTVKEIAAFITKIKNNKPNVTGKASYYNHLLNTKNNQSSTTLTIKHIQELLQNK